MKTTASICSRCPLLLRRSNASLAGRRAEKRRMTTSNPNTQHPTPLRKPHPTPHRAPERTTTSFAQTQPPPDPNDPVLSEFSGSQSDKSQRVLLKPNNLFHSYSNSPSPEMRRRAAFIKTHAYCPHPSHQRTRQAVSPADPENRKPMPATSNSLSPAHVRFECPDCGIPVYCSEGHWMDDYEAHLEICDTLRQINEDDHDLRSGRFFPEFEYPEHQRAEEFVLNMSNWDTFFYTRDFKAMNEPRSLRQVTRLMTYPITIATVLHELSPYSMRRGGRLTSEGLRSLSALRHTLHPPKTGGDDTIAGLRPSPPPIRIFVLGARAESSLPRNVWTQITHCFPRAKFHLILVGPEAMANRDAEFPLPEATPRNPFRRIVEDRLGGAMKISTYVEYFHELYRRNEFGVFDPYFDVFVAFHPGLGHPASEHEWVDTLPCLLETKCPVICTGYTEWDMERDRRWVVEKTAPKRLSSAGEQDSIEGDDEGKSPEQIAAEKQKREEGEMDVLLEPGENVFRSLRWDLNDLDPGDVSCGNWGLWVFRGKRYEATHKDG